MNTPCDFCMGGNSMFIVNIDMICELQMKLTNRNALQPIIILNTHLKVCIWLSWVKMYCSKLLMEDRSQYVWSDFKCWPIKTSNIHLWPVLICSHVVISRVNWVTRHSWSAVRMSPQCFIPCRWLPSLEKQAEADHWVDFIVLLCFVGIFRKRCKS